MTSHEAVMKMHLELEQKIQRWPDRLAVQALAASLMRRMRPEEARELLLRFEFSARDRVMSEGFAKLEECQHLVADILLPGR